MFESSPTLEKFDAPDTTATGEPRAHVHWRGLKTLWLNTGTLCNLACTNCYIASSPRNDALVYLTLADVTPFLDEIDAAGHGPIEIGITGGEPFMAPEILDILGACLERGHEVLVLTNAMRPMMRPAIRQGLSALRKAHGNRLRLRVSFDHYTPAGHDGERGQGSFAVAREGLAWLGHNGFDVAIAGRLCLTDDTVEARAAFSALARACGLELGQDDTSRLVLFPEMRADDDPPEISTACWDKVGRDPGDLMCASQRMVVRRKGADRARVTACTLLAYDTRFELGDTLAEATAAPVSLNHPWCATFCVLGGASCSG